MRIGIIGTGRMGTGFARLLSGSHEVRMGSRDVEKARQAATEVGAVGGGTYEEVARDAEVLFLTVPWTGVEETLPLLGDVTGTVVVDVVNPYVGGRVEPLGDTSTAEEIQLRLPGARVVKGWNHVYSANLERPRIDGTPSTVILAGDDDAAKETVSQLARDMGFEPWDGGGLRAARALELLHLAQTGLNFSPATALILRRV